ncbi:MAG: cysteine hydrolase family protein [Actinomycetota bacterium]
MSDGPLLAVIDMQHVFGDADSPWATPGFDEVIEPIERLVMAFRDRVVFTRFLVPERWDGSWGPYYELWHEVTLPEHRDWYDLVEPWASRDPKTLDRPTFSKWGSGLETLIGPSKELVLCGVATDCCVITTALPAADAGMFVHVVGDACRGVSDAAQEHAFAICAGFSPQIEVTTVDEELARLALTP